jgi:hypothetical protein
MKEIEMRARIERLLEKTVRQAAIPVSFGVSMVLAGCSGAQDVTLYSAPLPDSGDSGNTVGDSGGGMLYMAPQPDADLGDTIQDDGAPDTGIGPDTGVGLLYMAQFPDAARPDATTHDSGFVGKYMAPQPDASLRDDAATDDSGPVALYMAPQPDASLRDDSATDDSGPVARYMAPQPDAAEGSG